MDSLKKYALHLSIILMAVACSSTQKSSAAEPKTEVQVVKKQEGDSSCLALQKKPNDFNTMDFSATHIAKASIEDDELIISFEYSGCEKGKPVLVLLESMPGKKALHVDLQLKSKGAGLCEMILEDQACFDLQTLNVPAKEWTLTINGTHELVYQPKIVQ